MKFEFIYITINSLYLIVVVRKQKGEKGMKEEKGFKSRLGFILASVGSAVGLGNLWAFPYKAGVNGGAVFVLVYVVMALLIGLVAMISEMYIGKRTGKNIVDSFRAVNKHMGLMGIMGLVCTVVIASYYILLGGWVLKYAWSYLVGVDFTGGMTAASQSVDVYKNYFANFSQGSWEPILFMGLFFTLAMVVLALGVQNGIEKLSKFLMPVLFTLMLGLMIWSLCLKGTDGRSVLDGLRFYLVPRPESMSSQTILAAMGQSFFSLSLGVGIMTVYGSYAKEQKGLGKSAFIVVCLDTMVALLAGFIIFPAIFALGNGVEDVAAGPGLFFVVLPRIFAEMGGAGRFFGFLFFFLVFVAAITSVISLVEVPLQTIVAKTKIKRPVAVAILAVVIFGLGILVSLSQGFVAGLQVDGMDLLSFFDTVISNFMMPIGSMIMCVTVGWFISKKEIDANFHDFKSRNVWLVFTKFITPVLIGIVLITSGLLVISADGVQFNNWRVLVTVLVALILFVAVNEIMLKVNAKRNPQMAISGSATRDFITVDLTETNSSVEVESTESDTAQEENESISDNDNK